MPPPDLSIYFVGTPCGGRPNPLAVSAGLCADGSAGPLDKRYEPFVGRPGYRVAASPAGADLVSNASDFLDPGVADEARRATAGSDRPAVFFDFSDDETPGPDVGGVLWRCSAVGSRLLPHERVLPALCVDVEASGYRFEPLPHEARPRVAFCGMVAGRTRRLVLRHVRGLDPTPHLLRARSLAALRASGAVETDFIVRPTFHGVQADGDRVSAARRAFVDNLAASPYALCVRGMGNYSLRFYEALSAGRVPVLIDTDCVLPFGDRIDWDRHIVRVGIDELPRAGDAIAAFHARHTSESFAALQRDNRALFAELLHPTRMLDHACRQALAGGAAAGS